MSYSIERPQITAEELAKEIASFCKETGKMATLAFDWRWWAKCPVSPHAGYIVRESIGYPLDLPEGEIKSALQAEGVYFKMYASQSGIGLVSATPFAEKEIWDTWQL